MQRNKHLEKRLSTLYGEEHLYEVKEPYSGRHGNYPAEIFCNSGSLHEIVELLEKLKFKKDVDYISDTLGMRGGIIQVVIKSQAVLKAFKEAISVEYKKTPTYNINHLFPKEPHHANKHHKTSLQKQDGLLNDSFKKLKV